MNVLSLFDGISCGQIALNRVGIKYDNYYASEIDKWAIKVTQHNYPNTIQLGDITKINGKGLPQIDLLIGGSPCQGFSFAGKQLNFNDPRSKLFFEYIRLLKECSPKYFLLENVKMKKEYQDIISKYIGVEPIMINSSLVSAQNRNRLYWSNIKISQPKDKNVYLKSILETDFEKLKNYKPNKTKSRDKMFNGDCVNITHKDKSMCLVTKMDRWHNCGIINFDGYFRFLTELECERLQTIPDNYTSICSNIQRVKMLGNAWTVDIISHIFSQI